MGWLSLGWLNWLIISTTLLAVNPPLVNGQGNFLSFLTPFLGSGTGSAPPPQPGAANIDGFTSLFQLPQTVGSAGGGGNKLGGNAAGIAQSILSAFSNSAGPSEGGNPFGEFLSLGQSMAGANNPPPPQAAAPPPPPRVFTPPPFVPPPTLPPFIPPPTLLPPLILPTSPRLPPAHRRPKIGGAVVRSPSRVFIAAAPPPPPERFMPQTSAAEPPNIFNFLEDVAKRSRERQQSRNRQQSPTTHQHRQASSPIGRLTDNFGQNFFKMLEELHQYVPNLPGPQSPSSPVSQALVVEDEQPLQQDALKADDIISTNQLMRAFLRTMSGQPLKPLPVYNDGTEAGRNRPLMDQLFESDILLTNRQMKAIVLAEAERKTPNYRRRVKRKVITGAVYRWPKQVPIPYTFREQIKEWKQVIRQGLGLWEKETCIRFAENGPGTDRIEFIKGSGCYSSVGKTGGNQKISIGYGCEDKGIVSHEVGHSLGFWHEQSRPDRDQYITLAERYIAGGTDGNFAKRSDLETDGMGLPYDLGSVMHYGPTAFTTDWDHMTIVTKDGKYQRTIGQRHGPSFIDVKQINRLYCHGVCLGTPVQCENGGYADPNNCLQCKCPPGIGGPRCNQVEQSEGICGGELTATGLWQHLTYKGKQKCNWRIKADSSARIRFIVDSVSYRCETTCRSFVEIKHNSDFQQNGFRACCDEKNLEVLSEQDEVYVISDNDSDNVDGAFTLRYIKDSGTPLPRPPPPAWIPGRENRAFRGVQGKGGVIEKFILNAIPKVRDPQKPVESVVSVLTDYFASSLLGTTRDTR